MVVIGSDHGGFQLKNHLKKYLQEKGEEVFDCGTESEESVDYPDFAKKVSEEVLKKEAPGIIICGTGIGVSMTANKVKGIRAALAHDEYTARMAREHNNANVLCLGGRVLDPQEAEKIVDVFLNTDFEGGRHQRRVEKIMALEE